MAGAMLVVPVKAMGCVYTDGTGMEGRRRRTTSRGHIARTSGGGAVEGGGTRWGCRGGQEAQSRGHQMPREERLRSAGQGQRRGAHLEAPVLSRPVRRVRVVPEHHVTQCRLAGGVVRNTTRA